MKNNNLQQQQIALLLLNGIGPIKARKLLQVCDNISEIFNLEYGRLAKLSGLSITFLKAMNREMALSKAADYLVSIDRENMKLLFITDPEFPRRLKNCDDAPLLLFYQGNVDLNETKMISVVGTRNATEYGKSICEKLILALRDQNVCVVSGMAYGIDICVHQLCLQYGVPTIGVLGHGLDRMYPALHRKTGEKMKLNGGLLTEFLPFTNPDKENFPKRNRIVAGMTDATIVIESKVKGGSLITAKLANDYNREVFAVPGNLDQKYSEGCNYLIAENLAHLYRGPEDFIKAMDWSGTPSAKQQYTIQWESLTTDQAGVCNTLKEDGPIHLDLLAHRTNLDSGKLGLVLFELEMQGMVRVLPGMVYSLTA